MFKKNKKTETVEAAANKTPKKKITVKAVLKIVIPILLVIILIAILMSVIFGNPNDLSFSDDGVTKTDVQKPDKAKGINGRLLSDSGMTVFADNGKLRLEYSPKDDLFLITDLLTGNVFRSYPEPIYENLTDENGDAIASDIDSYIATSETSMIMRSPVMIGYSKSGMEGGFIKGINQMKNVTKTVNFIQNGVQLVYEVGELELSFTVEITIDGSVLKYKIPRNGIVERETASNEAEDRRPLLASLSVLPYLCAHRNGDSGYYVSPDGSGALTYFNVPRVTNYNEYAKKIYGNDPTFDVLNAPDFSNESLSIGVYGVVDDNYMVTSFIDTGEANAMLKIGNPGVKNLDFYSIYFQYNYRYYYKLVLSGSGSYDMIIADMQLGDVEQSLYFDSDPTFTASEEETMAYDYSDVASKTRELLIEKWKRQWEVSGKSVDNSPAALSLRFFMGAETVSGGVLNELKVMTTFDDVRKIYEELEAKGVTDLDLTLRGWTNGGYYWNTTTKNKAESDFGGKKGLTKLNQWAASKDIDLSLDNNLLIIYGSPSGVNGASLRNSVVKKPNTYYLDYAMETTSGRFKDKGYWMSPLYFDQELLESSISRLKSYKTTGVTLHQLGDTVYTDYNEENALLRLQTVRNYVEWLKAYRESFDRVSVYYGYDYAAAVADSVIDIPMEMSHNILLDEEIPFLQMVYHGLMNYYSAPINNQDSTREAILKSVEYGALMSYEVTKAETDKLQYTDYLFLFKAQFGLLKDEICDTYKIVEEAVKPFAKEQITAHSRVDSYLDVFCTEYSGGARVYVNYTNSDYTLPDGNVVASMNYLVVKD